MFNKLSVFLSAVGLALAGLAFGVSMGSVAVDAATDGYAYPDSSWPTYVEFIEDWFHVSSYYQDEKTLYSDDSLTVSSTNDPFEGVYVPVSAHVSYDGENGTMSVDDLRFARYAMPAGGFTDDVRSELRKAVDFSPLPCFFVYNPAYETQYVYTYRATLESFFSSINGSTPVPVSTDPLQTSYIWTGGVEYFLTSYPGQLPVYLSPSVIDVVYEDLVYTYVYALRWSDNYQSAYTRGYDSGRSDGYQEGYTVGRNEVTSEGQGIVNLFGAVATVPITILNGLSGLTVWDISIVSISMTFVFIGAILWLIKRFI